MKKLIIFLLCCAFWLTSFFSVAEQKQQRGAWDVHYIALPATLLQPEIAKQYQIYRSKYNGLINISVLNTADQKAQKVQISGQAINLLGQSKSLDFKEVTEGQAVYYLSQLGFRSEEPLKFVIRIQQGSNTEQLEFNHTFYVD